MMRPSALHRPLIFSLRPPIRTQKLLPTVIFQISPTIFLKNHIIFHIFLTKYPFLRYNGKRQSVEAREASVSGANMRKHAGERACRRNPYSLSGGYGLVRGRTCPGLSLFSGELPPVTFAFALPRSIFRGNFYLKIQIKKGKKQ